MFHTNDAVSPEGPRAVKWVLYVHIGLVLRRKRVFNGFESQQAVFVRQTSSECGERRKGKER